MRAEDGTDAGRLGGLLELHRAVHAVGVGADEGAKAARDRGLDQCRRAGGAEAEGEMSVDVQVSEHSSAGKRESGDAEK